MIWNTVVLFFTTLYFWPAVPVYLSIPSDLQHLYVKLMDSARSVNILALFKKYLFVILYQSHMKRTVFKFKREVPCCCTKIDMMSSELFEKIHIVQHTVGLFRWRFRVCLNPKKPLKF